MAITSTQSLLDLLEKSQLLSAKDLEKVRTAARRYGDAAALARALVAGKALSRWQAGQLLAGRSAFRLGKYRLIELLGRGGMGSVFKAEDVALGRRVALKIISKQTGRDPARLEAFLEETRRIAALNHPNIVRAYDVDHEGERFFLVMEFVEGRDLQQMVESEGPLDVSRAARFIQQAALGLAHAHDRKMIHCDIKPANLIVNEDDVVKILDMGMARLVASDGSSSDSNEKVVGTIDYMAPEQALEAEDLDHRVDIYSLGCTFFFLLTSRPPFGGGTLAQRILKHQTQNPPPISKSRSGVPDELERVCLQMTARNPEERFQTAAEIAQALEPWTGISTGKMGQKKEPLARLEPAVQPLHESPKKGDASDGVDIGEVTIAVANSGSFLDRLGTSRHRSSAAVRKAVEKTPSDGVTGGFFSDPRKKWTAIIVAVVLLLVCVGTGLVWIMGRDETTSDAASQSFAGRELGPVATVPTESLATNDRALDLEGGGFAALDAAFGSNRSAEESPAETVNVPVAATAPDSSVAPDASDEMPATEKHSDEEPREMGKKAPATDETGGDKTLTGVEQETKGEHAKKSEEKKSDENRKNGEPKPDKEPENKVAKAEPFKEFPGAVSIPLFSDSDPAGEASKAPMQVGTIHSAADMNWQMLLVGGDKVLKGGRKFVLAQAPSDATKAAWTIRMEGGGSGEGNENVATLWRDGQTLHFQWAEDAPGATANYLRNCFLQLRVSGESKHTALTEPIHADPIQIDLVRGQSNSGVTIRWAPDDEMLRFKFETVEGFQKTNFDPQGPVPPKTPVALNFVYTDSHQNDSTAVTFRILPTLRKTSLNVDMRLATPTPRIFQTMVGNHTEQSLGVAIDRFGNQRSDLQRRMKDKRGEELNKLSREIDNISRQMWYHDFFLKTHKKAALHYQVVADVGGQELVLVTTR